MAWMMDEYSVMHGRDVPGMITGKPLVLGGSAGRHDATARGALYCVREAARHMGMDLEGRTMAIQGCGNGGQYAALLGAELLGLKTVAISDSSGCIYNEDGLDVAAVADHKKHTGSVLDCPESECIPADDLLTLDVDVLMPAAIENQLRADNAGQVRARIVAELANGPTTPEADDILHENGVYVIPDFLANAGGVTCSYFEQVQSNTNHYWEREDVLQKLEASMVSASTAVLDLAERRKVSLRDAAYLISVDRVVRACRDRGWIQ